MWKACLWLAVKGTGATPRLTKIKIDPAAALVFPSAQLSGACGITPIEGLGVADGDYTLLDDPSSSRPAWIGTSPYIQHLVLSYLQDEGVWAIGGNNLFHAFLRVDAAMPPVYSSLWQVFDHESSAFHGSGKVVSISCPGDLGNTLV